MRQFAGIIVSFILLLVMLKGYPKISGGKKAPLGPVLFITGLIMALIAGLSFEIITDFDCCGRDRYSWKYFKAVRNTGKNCTGS